MINLPSKLLAIQIVFAFKNPDSINNDLSLNGIFPALIVQIGARNTPNFDCADLTLPLPVHILGKERYRQASI